MLTHKRECSAARSGKSPWQAASTCLQRLRRGTEEPLAGRCTPRPLRSRRKRQRSAGCKHAATMTTRIRTRLVLEAARANREQLARLAADVRAARTRRHLTQAQLGARVGLSQSAVSRAER